jgi:hypothetical protein
MLLLSEYAASLDGWRDLFQGLGELYLHSFPELRKIPGANLLRVEIIAEEPGSYEAVIGFAFLAAASGIIGARADAAALWTFRKLVNWYRDAISGYVRTKSTTTDVEAIAAALESMTRDRGIPLESGEIPQDDRPLFDVSANQDIADVGFDEVPHQVNRARILAERLDHSLKNATAPLDHSCERVTVEPQGASPVLEIGPAERALNSRPADPSPTQQGLAVRAN